MKLKLPRSKQDPAQSYMSQRRNILNEDSNFFVKEAYKALRTNIRFSSLGEGSRKLCVTSSLTSEGKSITTLNLAISFAEAGQKVLLIDADMRRPTIARLLIENGAPGLSNVLAGLCEEEAAVRKELYPNLDVMFSGEIPPNPSELLSTLKFEQVVQKFSQEYDYVFIDTPPVNMVTDACIVASVLDGVLFVVRQNETDRDSVTRGVNQLNMSGAKILGFILNGADNDTNPTYKRRSYKKYGYYGYGYRRRKNEEQGTEKTASLP